MGSLADGKVVAITGASSGIGEAAARLLARSGAKVILGARRVDRLERTVAELRSDGAQALARAVDVTDREAVKDFVEAAVAEYGRLDVLVNNAGVMLLGPLDDVRVEEWDRMVDVNVKGVLYGIAAALPIMRRQGGGHVVNVASVAGHRVSLNAAVYCGTKHMVRAVSEGFRQEAGPTLRSTIVSPGFVATELPGHITGRELNEATKSAYSIAIDADAVARAILFAVEQPDDVDVNEIVVRPTAQQS